ncbi:metallophosphoesterase domain-containing protein 1 [Peniophora sp. CONT]|nr:metallophosphoesterase domain-containing protein 1 [Peniophora sp. CONT]
MGGLDDILNRRTPSVWDRFLASPILFLAKSVSTLTTKSLPPHPSVADPASLLSKHTRLVCISDTHSTHASQPLLPEGDILIHAGDLTHSGTFAELDDALNWLSAQPHPIKIFIAGNHDAGLANAFERDRLLSKHPGLLYLEDEEATVEVRGRSLRVYGSPRMPKHGDWPFQYPRIAASASHSTVWSSIPSSTDILVTHGPPISHLDCDGLGCAALLNALWRIRPSVHVFGHVHAGRGVERVVWGRAQRAYEGVCRGRGWLGLVKLIWWVVLERGWMLVGRAQDKGTILVNAAAVGGLRDDRRLGAIVVDI